MGGEAAAAIFVNNHGPYTRASGAIATDATDVVVDAASGGKALADFNSAAFSNAVYKFPLHISKAASVAIAAGDILALNGRRYQRQVHPHRDVCRRPAPRAL